MALWVYSSNKRINSEDRKIKCRRQLLYFERTTKTREKEGDEFGNEDRNEKKARPQNERPSIRGASALEKTKRKRLDLKLLSVYKRLDSKDVECGLRRERKKERGHL